MENDVLYNRIMNVVHEEYGSGSTATANPEGEATDDLEKIQIGDDIYSVGGGGGVVILELTASGTGYDIGASFNELKAAFTSGKNIITHLEFSEEGSTGEDWSTMNIIELMEGEFGDEEVHFINLEVSVNNHDYAYNSMIDDPDADIVIIESQ